MRGVRFIGFGLAAMLYPYVIATVISHDLLPFLEFSAGTMASLTFVFLDFRVGLPNVHNCRVAVGKAGLGTFFGCLLAWVASLEPGAFPSWFTGELFLLRGLLGLSFLFGGLIGLVSVAIGMFRILSLRKTTLEAEGTAATFS